MIYKKYAIYRIENIKDKRYKYNVMLCYVMLCNDNDKDI